jgi:hypothetical protein
MKTAVAITLIICGVVVVAIPALSHAWDSFMVTMTLTHLTQPGSSVNIPAMSDPYQFGCWVLGAAMIALAVALSMVAGINVRSPRLAAAVV